MIFRVQPSLPLILLSLFGPAHAVWVKQSDDVMGTRVMVESWHADRNRAQDCNRKVIANMHRIDALMSTYKADSEISSINQRAAVEPVRVSMELFDLLLQAQQVSRLSNGAFDITYASVGQHYDYRAGVQPDAGELTAQLKSVDFRGLHLADQAVRFARPSMRIDLGGIAKGHAVDQGVQILKDCGVEHAIVSAGGDSRVHGDKRGRPWILGIQHPRNKQDIALRLPLSDTAISTSGDYERFFLQNGERIHHIINPKTGRSARNAWSASVIGPNATLTDALSTTLFILGADRGIELINTLDDMDAIIIDARGIVHYSEGLEAPVDQQQE